MLNALSARLRRYRSLLARRSYRSGTQRFTDALNLIALALLWTLLPLESPFWRSVRRRKRALFPHVNFDAPTPADWIRLPLQALFLVFVHAGHVGKSNPVLRAVRSFLAALTRCGEAVGRFGEALIARTGIHAAPRSPSVNTRARKASRYLTRITLAGAAALALLAITQPFDLKGQIIFLSVMLASAWVFTHVRARITLMVLFVISVTVSGRYLWWRCTGTIRATGFWELTFSLLLLGAEIYAFIVMVLGYFQVCWVLDRRPVPLPEDRALWPHVDIFIPTYNESLEVIEPTIFAAVNLDWPTEKLHVHLLDDGSRPALEAFAASVPGPVGVHYIKRREHNHAKAGNINHAMSLTQGEYIVIFDCDHVPSCDFLTKTVGWLVADPRIALVQTPHHFYSPDPFEKNLHLEKAMPIENALFHDFIQKGNDTWNAVMFCGSSAVMRRKALDEVGGIAVETVTEDAHTSLKLNRRGWKSAFIATPLASGLSTESLRSHVGQRIRWARGMIQILRLDNPLLGRGLTLAQRLCFFNAMLHFLHGLPRLIFLLAPLPYMLAGIHVIYATAASIFAYVLPHMVHAAMTNHKLQRGYRFPFLGGVYEAVLSWYILLPTTVALIFPHKGKFNVTDKGVSIASKYVDWGIARPILILIALNAAALAVGLVRAVASPDPQVTSLVFNLGWVLFNLVTLGAAFAVAVEDVQKHRLPRVALAADVMVRAGCRLWRARSIEYAQDALRLKLSEASPEAPAVGQSVEFCMQVRGTSHSFAARVALVAGRELELTPILSDLSQKIAWNRVTFSRPGMWAEPLPGQCDDRLSTGLKRLAGFAAYGYGAMLTHMPGRAGRLLRFILSLLPRMPQASGSTSSRVSA